MEVFAEAYKKLNTAQKQAVDAVEGPVLVVAGPGTGKTHILTLRIANILRQTQATAGNILVLTFTESAARTVRRRLGDMIGEVAAREAFISTFHGFAEHLLSTYPDSFAVSRGKRLAGDVEATLLWREVLETEELTALRTTKSPYFYLKDLARLRDDLVRERISLSAYRSWLEEEGNRIRSDESLLYVRGEKKGELKAEGVKKLERLEKGVEAIRLIEAYEALKEKRTLYDFADVLAIAVDGLQNDADLRATVQEQYQYILADEHQDANALQHELLDMLAYDDHPNIFVVGDEKQAIYRFQGADSSHFATFIKQYPRTEVVYLTDSYRSLQGVLDVSHALIEQVPAATGEHQKLTATRDGQAKIELLVSPDPLAERDQVATLVEQAIANNTPPHEIAIIASRNATATLFAQHLQAKDIPTLRAGDIDIASRPLLRAILALMRAIADPLDTASLRETLLAPWWNMPLADRAKLLLTNRDRELAKALESAYPDIGSALHTLQQDALSLAPLALFSKMLADTGARTYLLTHAEHFAEDISLLRRIVMHLEEIVVRDQNQSFRDVVDAFMKAHEHGLTSIKSSVTLEEGKVTVITAHKAKGMEFEKVFVVGLTANQWEKGGMAQMIPSPIDQKRTLEDLTKLFYVALTRAKDEIVLSYAETSDSERDTPPSVLIPSDLPQVDVPYDPLPLLHTSIEPTAVVTELVRHFLTNEGLSPSAFNEYLESPPTFFARRVLRLHEPETPATAIGTSVHAGIAEYLQTKDKAKAKEALAAALRRSFLPRNAAYDRVVTHATESLEEYLTRTPPETIAVEKAYTLTKELHGVPILLQGKVDAVLGPEGAECIVDFKTSSDVHIKDEKHTRQLAFYDLLLRAHGHAPTRAAIVQVNPDGVTDYDIPLTDETRTELSTTLEEVVGELLSGKWRHGSASDYDEILHLFE